MCAEWAGLQTKTGWDDVVLWSMLNADQIRTPLGVDVKNTQTQDGKFNQQQIICQYKYA